MSHEIAVAILLIAMLTFVGWPLGTWLSRAVSGGPAPDFITGFALAPAFGIAVTVLVATPLYMYVGPAEAWAWPALTLLLLFGAGALGVLFGRARPDPNGLRGATALSLTLLAVAICLAAPAVLGGINRVVFQSNPSDSVMYLTLAESARTASWEQLTGYKENAAELVRQNPLALYSARFIGVFMRFATGVDLGWLSQVSGIGVERLLWPFAFAMGIATASAAWALGRIIGLPALIASLAATTITLGFWGAMPREADAYSNLQSMPLLLGLIALRVWNAKLERPSVVLAIGAGVILAAFVQAYTELAIFAVGILAAEAVARLLLLGSRLGTLSSFGISLGAGLAVLFATGQLGYLIEITTNQYHNIAVGAATGGFAFENEVRSDIIGGIAGFPWFASAVISVGAPAWLGKAVTATLSVLTIIAAASAGALTLWPKQPRYTLAISVGAAGGVLMALVAMFAGEDIYLFQKAMTNAAPLCILLLALSTNSLGSRIRIAKIAAAVALGLLTLQLVFPVQTLIRDFSGRWPGYSERFHTGRDYDLSELRRRLDERCPCALLVNAPPSQDWWWAAYVALSLSRYQPYYQMGYFYDNGPKTVMLPTSTPQTLPQLAVIDSRDDYVGIQRLGQLLYDTGRLRLYEIRTFETAPFRSRPVAVQRATAPGQ